MSDVKPISDQYLDDLEKCCGKYGEICIQKDDLQSIRERLRLAESQLKTCEEMQTAYVEECQDLRDRLRLAKAVVDAALKAFVLGEGKYPYIPHENAALSILFGKVLAAYRAATEGK